MSSSSSSLSLYAVIGIVCGMLSAGTATTLLTKLQDRQCVLLCDSPQTSREFAQPLWQTLNMFLGELLCFFVFIAGSKLFKPKEYAKVDEFEGEKQTISPQNIQEDEQRVDEWAALLGDEMHKKKRIEKWGIFRLAIPAMLDLTATTLLNVGLLAVSASIYQMLRGIVILFTSLYAAMFLKRKIIRVRIFGLAVVFLGVVFVGASPLILGKQKNHEESKAFSEWVGILMILLAQAIAAAQFTYEEYLLENYENLSPLILVGTEGVFGTIAMAFLMSVSYGVAQLSPSVLEGNFSVLFDIEAGARQLFSNSTLYGSSIGLIFGIALFNFCGLNVTKYISAVARTTIDTCRTILIWGVSLGLGWETFLYVQIFGFVMLIYGTFVYNQIIPAVPEFILKLFRKKEESTTHVKNLPHNARPQHRTFE
jgi:drug/metabolite transporter (DMT)-like permease